MSTAAICMSFADHPSCAESKGFSSLQRMRAFGAAARARRLLGLALVLSVVASVEAAPEAVATLTLAECRQLVLAHNLTLKAEREALLAAGFLRAAEMGAFEPEFVASVKRERNRRENTVEQILSQGTSLFEEENTVASIGLEGLTPTGARYRIGWNERDISNNLRLRATDPFRNEFQSFLGASVTQPLLKDFGFSASLARIRLAKGDEKLARQDFRRQLMLILGATEAAYWDLYVAQERLRLRNEGVASAERLLKENNERVGEGKMAPIELIEAEAGLAQRKSLSSEAEQRWVDAGTRLKTLFAEASDGSNWALRASDQPSVSPDLPKIEEVIGSALTLHPEYLARVHKAEQENVRVAYARNQRWPQVDLVLSYGKNGLGDNRDSSWEDIDKRNYEAWTVGLEVRVPITAGVRKRNEVKAAKAKQREALLNLKAAEVDIVNALVGAQRKVESLLHVASNHQSVADAAQRLIESERTRLSEGKSDSRRLIEVENQFADASVAALESRGEFQRARVEWELASGRLLRERGVDLESDLRAK